MAGDGIDDKVGGCAGVHFRLLASMPEIKQPDFHVKLCCQSIEIHPMRGL
jgi:hypothetical protein